MDVKKLISENRYFEANTTEEKIAATILEALDGLRIETAKDILGKCAHIVSNEEVLVTK